METVYVVMGLHPSHAMNEIKAVSFLWMQNWVNGSHKPE